MQTRPHFYNSHKYKVSYYRIYKSASSTIVNLLGEHSQEYKALYPVFSVIRNPFTRAKSIHREMLAMRKTNMNFIDFFTHIKNNGMNDKHQLYQSALLRYCKEPCKLFTLEDNKWIDYIGVKEPIENKNVRLTIQDSFTAEEIELINDIYGSDVDLYLNIK